MHAVMLILFVLMIALMVYGISFSFKKKNTGAAVIIRPEILEERVRFYALLSAAEKELFRKKAAAFLSSIRITPINTTLTDEDEMLIAAAAVIPMFAFDDWTYPNLEEILVYNDHFNMEFHTEGNLDRNIMGLVGTGAYSNKMLLSKNALQRGFENTEDRSNTAIHEFVHLIDAADGDTDGVPKLLMDKAYTIPWLELIHREMEKMHEGNSDINPYGYKNKSEFFAVASEYFFERPELFKENHPDLYEAMSGVFRTRQKEMTDNSLQMTDDR